MARAPLALASCLALSAVASFAGAQVPLPFPGEIPGANVGLGLPPDFESSGIVWHPRLQKLLLVGDEGRLATMEANGTLVALRNVFGDLEGITLADPETDFAYVGVENPPQIYEVAIATGAVTRVFSLAAWLFGTSNQGIEGLAFVPDASHPEGGRFHVAHQGESRVYVFSLPVKSSATATDVTFLTSYVPVAGLTDLADLGYDPATQQLYAIYDDPNRIAALTPSGTLVQQWVLPGAAQEGVAVRGCELFVAHDAQKQVMRYGAFPSAASCPPLSQDAAALSLFAAGSVTFTLRAAPPVAAGHFYVLLGSASGSDPGFDLLGAHVPLVPDGYFEVSASAANGPVFQTTAAPFAATLKAEARLALPAGLPPGLAGLHLTHAWIALDLAGGVASAVSNAVELVLIP